ncbi:hypothetical protein JWS13_05055 (plasmid) [Rhodococcus pseudokoreensis]|uniref:Uncharacterized protein n=1 Tax=Rhodococcus pseudokoreensis TaxID=2811421 RepID=A0A974ZRU0_9NOCA|nr:hypothetical protein [Rhodococcus pseudokoreensis]QSE88030.1 hypothetical protein JWS13_05055 [Rhodococcus pseudokoreensis]
MNFLDYPEVSDHLTNWTAAGWWGGWATLLLAVLVGAVAEFTARTACWKIGGEDRWWLWPLAAAVLWVASIWVLAVALSDLGRHSTNSQVVASICLGGALVGAAAFYPAIKVADTVFGDPYDSSGSRLRFLVGALPSVVVVVTAVAVIVSEYSIRGELFQAFLRMTLVLAFFGIVVGGVVKVVSRPKNRSSYRY